MQIIQTNKKTIKINANENKLEWSEGYLMSKYKNEENKQEICYY